MGGSLFKVDKSWQGGEEGVNFEQRLFDVNCEQAVKYTCTYNVIGSFRKHFE